MPESPLPQTHIAREFAAGAVAERGRWHAGRWALGLPRRSWTDARDTALVAIAVLFA